MYFNDGLRIDIFVNINFVINIIESFCKDIFKHSLKTKNIFCKICYLTYCVYKPIVAIIMVV